MPYQITWLKNGVQWDYSGHVSGQEIVESIMAIFGDPDFDELHFQIADLSKIESADVHEREMKKAAYLDKAAAKANPRINVAIIAPNPLSQIIGQQYIDNASDSPWKCAMFESRKEAEAWLNKVCDLVEVER